MNNCGIGFADCFKKCDYSHYFKIVPVGHTTFIHYSLFTIQYSFLVQKMSFYVLLICVRIIL